MSEGQPVPMPLADEKLATASTSSGTTGPMDEHIFIDPEIEKRVLRKCDLRVIPPTLVLFMLSFLDRVNIVSLAHFCCSDNADKMGAGQC
jgi:hypothetical protein